TKQPVRPSADRLSPAERTAWIRHLLRASLLRPVQRGARTTMTKALAALILPVALLTAAPAQAQDNARYEACIAIIDDDAERAYEEGMAWAAEGQILGGYRCAALALVAQGRHEEGARRLE